MIKSGSYVFLLCDHYIIMPWMSSCTNAGFLVIPYPYKFVYRTTTVPYRHISGFPKIVLNSAVVAETAWRHPDEFQPNFTDVFVDVDCPSLTNSAATSNILWSTKKLMKPGTREPLRKTKQSIRLISAIVQIFTPLEGNVLDLYGATFSTASAALGIKRSCTSIEKDED